MILTDAKGKPIEKPKREDFSDSTSFLRAMAEYNDRVRKAGSEGFDKGFRAGVKGKKTESSQREPDDEATRKAKVAEMMKKWAAKGK